MEHDENNQIERSVKDEQSQAKQKEQTVKELRKPPSSLASTLLDAIEFQPSLFGVSFNFSALFNEILSRNKRSPVKRDCSSESVICLPELPKSEEERKLEIVKQLLDSNIDPSMFDVLLQNEVDRRLKVRFGVMFLLLTFIFTTASYAIIIFNSMFKWNISEVAITALIIETPIQFIGLLYIIARNLFPQHSSSSIAPDRQQN